jgi:hypothetical protein|tara:strand:+ start:1633 stop:2166 length:534 start_codon:yes stop_codon:yes gene_type:complete
MKKYLLFIFGYTNEEFVLETLADLEKISDDIRFFTGDGYGIYHFESKDVAEDISNTLSEELSETIQSMFVFSLEGEHAIEMDQELKDAFLDAKFDNRNIDEKLGKIEEKYKNIIDEADEDKIGIIPLKELLKRHLDSLPERTLTVDDMLDKILEKGLESLTKREKDFLDNQKKNIKW